MAPYIISVRSGGYEVLRWSDNDLYYHIGTFSDLGDARSVVKAFSDEED